MNNFNGFTLIHCVARGNVIGVVLAPTGTEDAPKAERAYVWRVRIGVLDTDVNYPESEVREVVRELFDYCVREGLASAVGGSASPDA